jgi:hypothetical protein
MYWQHLSILSRIAIDRQFHSLFLAMNMGNKGGILAGGGARKKKSSGGPLKLFIIYKHKFKL